MCWSGGGAKELWQLPLVLGLDEAEQVRPPVATSLIDRGTRSRTPPRGEGVFKVGRNV